MEKDLVVMVGVEAGIWTTRENMKGESWKGSNRSKMMGTKKLLFTKYKYK